MLDQGKEPDDVFEEEVLQCGAFTVITELHLLVWLLILTALCSWFLSGGSKLRRQWVGNLKVMQFI